MLVAGGKRGGTAGGGTGWRRRHAAWRQAAVQKRRRPTGRKPRPQTGQAVVWLSLRDGAAASGLATGALLSLPPLQRPPEAVRLRAGLDDVGAVRGPVQQRLTAAGVGD